MYPIVGEVARQSDPLTAPAVLAAIAAPSTPMPSGEPGCSGSPAWDPSSRTPETSFDANANAPSWLADIKMIGIRVQVVERAGDPHRRLEVKNVEAGEVMVRDCSTFRCLPLSHVIPVSPRAKGDLVVSFAPGESFGKIFKVKTFGHQKCEVKDFTGKSLSMLSTMDLASIYPPYR